jgi:hypothetical protein
MELLINKEEAMIFDILDIHDTSFILKNML